MFAFTSLIQHCTGTPDHSNHTRIHKRHPVWKGKSKIVIVTPYIESPKDSTRKILELINKFSKVAGYKINIQISVAFLYANNGLSVWEIKKTIPFTIASKIIKYLGINLTKDIKDLYLENYAPEERN